MKKIGIILVFAVLFIFIGAKVVLNNFLDEVNSITVLSPDLANISDGVYVGEYSVTPVRVKVEVFVAEHKITDIKIIEHENGLGSKAEKIVNDIVSKQSLEVDAVSGATVSSKCIIKAIENALQSENDVLVKEDLQKGFHYEKGNYCLSVQIWGSKEICQMA